jgi:pimeloyl-ACP methyl ester carboxylesterase
LIVRLASEPAGVLISNWSAPPVDGSTVGMDTPPSRAGRAQVATHSHDVTRTYNQMLGPFPGRHRHVPIGGERREQRAHVIEAGDGPPAVFLHGANTSSLSFLMLLEHLEGVHAIAVDRPGRGLSDPAPPVARSRFRDAAVEFVDDVLTALGLDAVTLVGQSGGGVWALWYAMERPERVRSLVLLGSIPLLPRTRCPALLRLMAAPGLSSALTRLAKPSPKSLIRLLSSVGEGDTIIRYPEFIDATVAAGNDPVAATADLAELRAVIQPFVGYRRSMRFRPTELRALTVPTLVIWGDRDPIGSVDVAQTTTGLIPDATLEVLPAGHVPQFGHPQRVATLISDFVRSHHT